MTLQTLRRHEAHLIEYIIYAQDHGLPESEKFNQLELQRVRDEIREYQEREEYIFEVKL